MASIQGSAQQQLLGRRGSLPCSKSLTQQVLRSENDGDCLHNAGCGVMQCWHKVLRHRHAGDVRTFACPLQQEYKWQRCADCAQPTCTTSAVPSQAKLLLRKTAEYLSLRCSCNVLSTPCLAPKQCIQISTNADMPYCSIDQVRASPGMADT